ncbi:MAG TPA: hypothetical protein VEC16_05640 [Alphaproteobacteria bacterium]|nr:hypothetical protein [Alphaproteobacteria bacterium]
MKKSKSSEKNVGIRIFLGIVCIIALVANIVLRLGFKLYNDIVFWIIIIITAIIAWPVMNYLKK